MAILTATGLTKYYGGQDVIKDIALSIEPGDRIGLVGPNGEGKTTLLRILAGLEEPNAGRVEKKRNLTIGYLPQHAGLEGHGRLYEAMLPAFERLLRQQAALRDLELQMGQPACPPQVFERYGTLQTEFELAGGYLFESQIRQVLSGLGFDEEDYDKPLSIMSGGQRTRALLARTLLEAPDLLLLDEPTNHLDLEGIEWLERYLSNWQGSMVVVAHDRRFLDKLVTRIWDLALGRLELYEGNYSRYVALRDERMSQRQAEYEAQQQEIAHTEAFIERYGAGQRAKEAKGRWRRLQRLERLERPQEAKRISLDIQTDVRSGDLVLRTYDLEVGFAGPPGHRLFRCPDLVLRRGERVAVLGPNGVGKTTLVRTVVGELPPLSGEVRLGASVRVGYLAQAHADLQADRTVLEEVLETRNLPLAKARNFLGRFLFSGDSIYKLVRDLSGGERSRVALAKLTLEGANFLVLDEPTNHLDIASQEILEGVLGQFRGTILLISHDRQLVDALATQIWLIRDGHLTPFMGNYSGYLESIDTVTSSSDAQGRADQPAPEGSDVDERRERQRAERRLQREERRRQERLRQIEAHVAELERDLGQLERELEAASVEQKVDDLYRLGEQYREVQDCLSRLMDEWASLA